MIPAFDTDLDLAFLADDGEDIAEILTVACESFSSRGIPSSHGECQ